MAPEPVVGMEALGRRDLRGSIESLQYVLAGKTAEQRNAMSIFGARTIEKKDLHARVALCEPAPEVTQRVACAYLQIRRDRLPRMRS